MNNYSTKELYKFYRENGGTLAYKPYKDVIASFHKELSIKIMDGYIAVLPYYLGTWKIIRKNRKISIKENGNVVGAVDWKASNDNKKVIIDRGEIPLVNIKDENNNIISSNNGIPWLIHRTDEFYYSWIRVVNIYLHNYAKYTFKPTWANARALVGKIDNNSELIFHKANRNARHQDRVSKSIATKNEQPIWAE